MVEFGVGHIDPTFKHPKKGLLLAFMGLPGSGKSSTARALCRLIPKAMLFPEPEENQWPLAVTRRHEFGYFTAISWFRSMRVPLLHMADAFRKSGGIAIVDSYYDKLFADYISHPDMKWLIPQDDHYYSVMREIATLDRDQLPEADCLVFLTVSAATWQELLLTRRREMDQEESFLQSYPSQEQFLLASQAFAKQVKRPLVVHQQHFGTPEVTAKAILEHLREQGIIE